jgi:hypothetical protein
MDGDPIALVTSFLRPNFCSVSPFLKEIKDQNAHYEGNPVSNYVHMIPPFIAEIDMVIMATIP